MAAIEADFMAGSLVNHYFFALFHNKKMKVMETAFFIDFFDGGKMGSI